MRLKWNIATKLMLAVVLVSSLITLLTTAYQLYGNYNHDISLIDDRFNEIEQVHLNNLTSRLWIADIEELKNNLTHFLFLPEIQYLEVYEQNKPLIKVGVKKTENIIERQYPLIFRNNNKPIEIGTLVIHATLDGVYQRIYDQIISILISNAIKTFLVTGFILFLFYRLVTRHLLKFSQFAKNLTLNNIDHKLKLDRKTNHNNPDELDVLVKAFSSMQSNLKESISTLNDNWERYRVLVESSQAIPWELDLSSWKFTYIGPQIEKILGYKPEEWYEENFWLHHIHPDDREQAFNTCVTSTEKMEDHEFKYRMIAKDGREVWIQDDVRIIRLNNKPVKLQGFMFDISLRIKNENELELYHKELERLVEERTKNLTIANQELESFSYSVSHDLRSPLRAINGFSLALLDDCEKDLNEEGKEYLERIIRNTERMSELIDDILNLSKITRSEMNVGPVALDDIAHDIIINLKRENPDRKVEFNASCNKIIHADQRLIRIALENLLGNAWKYTNKKDIAIINLDSYFNKNEIVFMVQDNGAGFNMSFANNLFGVFQRLHSDKDFDGTGIGLATVKRIIERHGGRIWSEAEVDKGATFYFTLSSENISRNTAFG